MENKADIGYSRQLDLEERFNRYWNQALKTNGEDYLKRLTTDDLVELKKAVSNINNLVTLRVTYGFIEKIHELGIINRVQAEKIKAKVDGTHPNTNGYDVEYDAETKIIAEIKCNIPVGGNRFGSAQRNAIKEDLQGLWNGKNKGKIIPASYYKFMVIQDISGAREAMEQIVNSMDGNYATLDDKTVVDTDHVYIVYW